MANAPQGNGGASAEGGYVAKFSSDTLPSPDVTNRNNDSVDNVVQRLDVTSIANEGAGPSYGNDHDYDDPYGPTVSTGSFSPVVPES